MTNINYALKTSNSNPLMISFHGEMCDLNKLLEWSEVKK